MKRAIKFFLLLNFIAGNVCAQTALTSQPAADLTFIYSAQQQVFRRGAERIAPCVVTIETIGGTQPPENPSAKTGFLIADGPTTGLTYSSDGLILTSSFNFARAPSVITVILPDGRRFVAELLARDELRQLAMLKIEASDLPTPQWVENSSSMRVGQWALALGRGFGGSECSISAGIISGLNRMSGLAVQTDAKLSPANYGGPLVDIKGKVLGICVPMGLQPGLTAGVEWYDSGIGFAIPYQQILETADDLAVGHNIRYGLLGIVLDPRDKSAAGVQAVADPSPARRFGIKAGDQIVAIDGQKIQTYLDLKRVLRAYAAGQWVTVRIKRNTGQIDLQLILAVREDIGELTQQTPGPEAKEPGSN